MNKRPDQHTKGMNAFSVPRPAGGNVQSSIIGIYRPAGFSKHSRFCFVVWPRVENRSVIVTNAFHLSGGEKHS